MANMFLINTRAELVKAKRSSAFWLAVLSPAFLPAVFFLIYFFKPKEILKEFASESDPWLSHFSRGFQSAAIFLIPMFVILTASLITQIETRNNTWKQVYASPLKVSTVFFSKFLVIQSMIIMCYILFSLFMILSAALVNLLNKDYPFFTHHLDLKNLFLLNAKSWISILGMSAIQYWLSLRFKNFIAAIGIGLALIITGLTIINWEKIYMYPYAYSALSFFKWKPAQGLKLYNHELNSIGWMIVVLILAYIDTLKRKERG